MQTDIRECLAPCLLKASLFIVKISYQNFLGFASTKLHLVMHYCMAKNQKKYLIFLNSFGKIFSQSKETEMRKVKTINSHSGYSRFLAECETIYSEDTTPTKYLARVQTAHIPSPYQYSPSVAIERWNGKDVVVFETRHKHYEVYEVPADFQRFDTREEATDYHIQNEAGSTLRQMEPKRG